MLNVNKIKIKKKKKEYYLTDIISLAKSKKLKIGLVETDNDIGSRGINNIKEYIEIKKKYDKKY